MQLSIDLMYNAIVNKDTSFEGIFFTAVKTTGIFCRPSCTARKPKKENVEFFSTAKEAISKGYRPCKVCNPMEKLNETPDLIKAILNGLADDPSRKFKDEDLIALGIEPSKIRRWFLKNHGVTFQAYQRMFRINSAFKKIQNGEAVTSTAFESGYESLSGFNDSFKNIFGVSPKNSKAQTIIDLKRIETPLGTMYACAVKEGICLLEFTDRKMLETEFKTLSKRLNATIIQGENKHFDNLEQQLTEYFEGKRKSFTVKLFTPGSAFQNAVWDGLQNIPYGTTKSYKEQAIALSKTDAVRAVANANGMNRISILIPCHRVIGTDGNLTGYGGGIWRKKWLLDMEKANGSS
ncbi:bifunctional transcriptional activator/DNA repair enzyme AdaA [Solitalea canadensis]|uniref:Methylated-DNA--protein-cysteine methyltransferase n=1 Tax=Solitalea canadensis (strain ATCC 29591 / DSM 3403 / JCM 21819 / LMG 8368 / NBRC 15130 / NCIMB 12057 / USAM 9D) TaxID=929556 RepID=H8KW95_SOLCM|nr:trifunctional transcriptional activator/DNA repair protein Ada/methylated-DNA--[protein]-cysteine S-methyltransferase [Solitalea canadensis]AFD07887.1 O-6-methylguanine DNA methyltransferase [Solitalea canadensis DSM 3403]